MRDKHEPSAKKKAKDLIDKFSEHAIYWDCRNDEPTETNHAKMCALIVVDEILKNDVCADGNEATYDNTLICEPDYWEKVKEEIEKLGSV